MERRNFVKAMLATTAMAAVPGEQALARAANDAKPVPDTAPDREYWCDLLYKMAKPVLSNMSKGTLKKTMTVELSPTWDGRDRAVTYMECFGRLMAGLSPWLTLPDDNTDEGKRRKQLQGWALESYVHSVDPKSPDYLLWRKEGQPLVDSAYFSNALMRAPKQLWAPLDKMTKARIVEELKLLRRVSAPYNNWLLFAAMNEAFLLSIGEQCDPLRINLAVKKINEWYVGDGWYSDGEQFHYDYYNSFVIHPMLVEILEVLVKTGTTLGDRPSKELYDQALKRMQRCADHLERMISPDGAFPPIGRSLTYRTAAFQPLALLAWRKQLPEKLSEGQVRSALAAVHKRIFANPTNFTKDGYLTLGYAGHQPELADVYSNNGSMYITTESFLPLGLPAADSFWTAATQAWTAKKAYANDKFNKDYPVKY
jgi:hypothetical protein